MSGQEIVPATPETPTPLPETAAPPDTTTPETPLTKTIPAATISPELSPFWDVPLHLTIEIGRLSLSLRDLMALEPGKTFGISKIAGEAFEICANGQAVALGEVIVIENSAGLRITEVLKL